MGISLNPADAAAGSRRARHAFLPVLLEALVAPVGGEGEVTSWRPFRRRNPRFPHSTGEQLALKAPVLEISSILGYS